MTGIRSHLIFPEKPIDFPISTKRLLTATLGESPFASTTYATNERFSFLYPSGTL